MKKVTLLLICLYWYAGIVAQTYEQQITAWHQQRLAALKAENGWLNLAGLFWLKEGDNRFGSNKHNDMLFPSGKIPASAGVFVKQGMQVHQVAKQKAALLVDQLPQTSAVLYDGSANISREGAYGSLRWKVIKREEKLGIRLRDLTSSALNTLKAIPRYPVNVQWRIKAVLQQPLVPLQIKITNVLGQTLSVPSPGKLVFTIGTSSYTFDTMEEEGKLFIVFGDATSGKTTYAAGRFLYAKMPGADGITELDFNQAINPPCAFTPYATCPLPPRQNILPIAVTAGEKKVHL